MADDGIEYLVAAVSGAGASGDHGDLTGLSDDDHPQYETSAEAAAKVTTHEAAADPHAGYVLESLYDAKGDLIAASAADTPAKLTVGTNGQRLEADSAQTAGLTWSSTSRLLPVSAPSAPASGATLYVDSGDSKLKAIKANGDIIEVG